MVPYDTSAITLHRSRTWTSPDFHIKIDGTQMNAAMANTSACLPPNSISSPAPPRFRELEEVEGGVNILWQQEMVSESQNSKN